MSNDQGTFSPGSNLEKYVSPGSNCEKQASPLVLSSGQFNSKFEHESSITINLQPNTKENTKKPLIAAGIKKNSTKELSFSAESATENINHGNNHLESSLFSKKGNKVSHPVQVNVNQKKRDHPNQKDQMNKDIIQFQIPKVVQIDKKKKVNFANKNAVNPIDSGSQSYSGMSPSTKKNTEQLNSLNQEKSVLDVSKDNQNYGQNRYDRGSHQKITQPKWISNKDTLSQTLIGGNLKSDSRNSMLPFVALKGRQSQDFSQFKNSSKVFTGVPLDSQIHSLASLKPQPHALQRARYQSKTRAHNGKQSFRNKPGGNFTLQSTKDFLNHTQNNSMVLQQKKERLEKLNQREYQKFMLDGTFNNQQTPNPQNFHSMHNIVHYLNVFQKERKQLGQHSRLSPVTRSKNATEDIKVAKGTTEIENADQGYHILRKTGMSSAINYNSQISPRNSAFNKTSKPVRRTINTKSFNKDRDLLESRFSSIKKSARDENSNLRTDYNGNMLSNQRGDTMIQTNQTLYDSKFNGNQNLTYSNFTQMGKTNAYSQMSHSNQMKKVSEPKTNIHLSYDSFADKEQGIEMNNDEYLCKSYYNKPNKQDINKDSQGYFHRKSQSQLGPTISPNRDRDERKTSPFGPIQVKGHQMIMPRLDLESLFDSNNQFTAHLDGLTKDIQNELSSRRQETVIIESNRSGSDRKSLERKFGLNLSQLERAPFGLNTRDSRVKMAQTSYRGNSQDGEDYKSQPRSFREKQFPSLKQTRYKIKLLEDKLNEQEFEISKRAELLDVPTMKSERTVKVTEQHSEVKFSQTLKSFQNQETEHTKNESFMKQEPTNPEQNITELKIPNQCSELTKKVESCHEKLGLYVEILDDFRKQVVKKYEKDLAQFLESMVLRMNQLKEDYVKQTKDIANTMGLFKIELDNQVQINLNIEYENIILRSKESTYNQIIAAAKLDDKNFQEKFQMAHDFLNGPKLENFVNKLEQEFALNMDSSLIELSEKLYKLRPSMTGPPRRLNQSKNKNQPDEEQPGLGPDDFAFSDVTKILKEAHEGQSRQLRIPPVHLSNQIEFKEDTLQIFISEITKRCSSVQVETGKRLWKKLEKHTQFRDQGIQASQQELDRRIDEQFSELGREILALKKQIALHEGSLRDAEAEKNKMLSVIAQQKVSIRIADKEKQIALEEAKEAKDEASEMSKQKGLAESFVKKYQQDLIAQKLQKDKLKLEMNTEKQKVQEAQAELQQAINTQSHMSRGQPSKMSFLDGNKKIRIEDSSNADYDNENDFVEDTASNHSDNSQVSRVSRMSRSRGLKRKKNEIKIVKVDEVGKMSDHSTMKMVPGGSTANQSNVDFGINSSLKGMNNLNIGSNFKNHSASKAQGKNQNLKPTSRNRAQRQNQYSSAQVDRSNSQSKFNDPDSGIRVSLKDDELSTNQKNSPANMGLHHSSLDTFDKQDGEKHQKVTHGVKIKTSREGVKRDAGAYRFKTLDQCTQTNQAIHFEYIMAFLKVIEERINNGDLEKTMMDVQLGQTGKFKTNEEMLADEAFRKSREKLRELQLILGKITSLRNGRGGDLFFRGLAKTFQAHPVVPPENYYRNFDLITEEDEDIQETNLNSPQTIGSRGQDQTARVLILQSQTQSYEKMLELEKQNTDYGLSSNPDLAPKFSVKTKVTGSVGGGIGSTIPKTLQQSPRLINEKKKSKQMGNQFKTSIQFINSASGGGIINDNLS